MRFLLRALADGSSFFSRPFFAWPTGTHYDFACYENAVETWAPKTWQAITPDHGMLGSYRPDRNMSIWLT
jgi:hypothetical protein